MDWSQWINGHLGLEETGRYGLPFSWRDTSPVSAFLDEILRILLASLGKTLKPMLVVDANLVLGRSNEHPPPHSTIFPPWSRHLQGVVIPEVARQIHRLTCRLTVSGRHTTQQTLRNGLKKFVADQMPQRIVNFFEAVQIQKQHSGPALRSPRMGDRLAHSGVQKHSIRQPGEKVVMGGMRQLLFQCPRRGYIVKYDNRSGNLPVAVTYRGDGIFDEKVRSRPGE